MHNMTEAPQATMPTPNAEPELVTRIDRVLIARWDVGVPDAEGFQKKAQLHVGYYKGHGYRAVLTTTEVKDEGVIVSEKFSFRDPKVLIYTQSATRFGSKKLSEAYTAALAALRTCFDSGAPEVVSIFNTAAATGQ